MAYKPKKKDGGKDDSKIKPSLDIFMILGNILVDKDMSIYDAHVKNEIFESAFSPFMILRYLTMNSNVNVRNVVLNNLTTLERMSSEPELLYKVLLRIIPQTHNRFTPYIKSGFPRAN